MGMHTLEQSGNIPGQLVHLIASEFFYFFNEGGLERFSAEKNGFLCSVVPAQSESASAIFSPFRRLLSLSFRLMNMCVSFLCACHLLVAVVPARVPFSFRAFQFRMN